MTENMLGIILAVCGFFSTARAEPDLYHYELSPQSWWKAQAYCKDNYNGSLIKKVETLSPILSIRNISDNATFWTGQMSVLSAWMWNIGCYNAISNIEKRKDFAENSAGLCQLYCNTSSYFALKVNQCVCLTKELPTSNKTSEVNCAMPCRNSKSFELCGGNTSYSVYRKGNFNDASATVDGQCVAIKYKQGSEAQLNARRCSEKHRIICNATKGHGHITNLSNTFTWAEGSKKCFKYNSTLAYDIEHTRQLYKTLSLKDFYWMGFYREFLEINKTDFPIENKRKMCTATTKAGVSSLVQCNASLPFVCQYTHPPEIEFSKVTLYPFSQTSTNYQHLGKSSLSSVIPIYDSSSTSKEFLSYHVEKTDITTLNSKASLNLYNPEPSYKTTTPKYTFYPDMTSTIMIPDVQSMITETIDSQSNLASDLAKTNRSVLTSRGIKMATSADTGTTLLGNKSTFSTQTQMFPFRPISITVENHIYRSYETHFRTITQSGRNDISVSLSPSSSRYALNDSTLKQHSITFGTRNLPLFTTLNSKASVSFETPQLSNKIANTKHRIFPLMTSTVMTDFAQSMTAEIMSKSDSNLASDSVKTNSSVLTSRGLRDIASLKFNTGTILTEHGKTFPTPIHILSSNLIPITVDQIYLQSNTEFQTTAKSDEKRISVSIASSSSRYVLSDLAVKPRYLTVDTKSLPTFADQVLVTTPIVNINGDTLGESINITDSVTLTVTSKLPKISKSTQRTGASTFYDVTTGAESLKNDDQGNRVLIASVTGSCGGCLLIVIALVVFLTWKKKRNAVASIHEEVLLQDNEENIKADDMEEM